MTSEHSKRPAMAFVSFIHYAAEPRDGAAAREPHVIMAAATDAE